MSPFIETLFQGQDDSLTTRIQHQPNFNLQKCLQKIHMQYSNPSGRKKNESSNSQLGQCGKTCRKLKPFATVHSQKTAVHRSNEAVQILSSGKEQARMFFSSLALSCCIAGLWQLSLNFTTLWDRRGIELHSPQKVGKRCIQNHSKSFKIIVSKYLPRRFSVCLHSTLRNAARASLVVKLSEHRGFPADGENR